MGWEYELKNTLAFFIKKDFCSYVNKLSWSSLGNIVNEP